MDTTIKGDNEYYTFYIVYYHNDCPFSQRSIRLLRRKLRRPDLELLLINVPRAGENLISLLRKRGIHDHNTFPAIFRNGRFIGGYIELKHLLCNQ